MSVMSVPFQDACDIVLRQALNLLPDAVNEIESSFQRRVS